jgi:DNA modification methylase
MFENTETKQTTVLGKTFNSEEERRAYFREELRKHLPELKKMEGFPIGEDEDILNLSDPPFYTACPNPWLNDFITEWEEEKKELEKKGKRESTFMVDEPYAADISEGKNNPIYNAHSYYTKVPHRVIMKYILHYTEPGDIVYDGFGGTGMTGVAAQMCGVTDNIDKLELDSHFFNQFGTNPKWGKRKAICNELSPIASFLASCFNSDYFGNSYLEDSQKLLNEIKSEIGWLYETKYQGHTCEINYILWSDIYSCNSCDEEFLYWNVMMDEVLGKPKKEPKCPGCSSLLNNKNMERIFNTVYDKELDDIVQTKKREIALINFNFNKRSVNKKPDKNDFELLNLIDNYSIVEFYPIERTAEGSEGRRNDRFGITHIHQFYSKRNLIASAKLRSLSSRNRHFLFGFFNTTWHGTLMRRYNSGGGHRPKTGTLYMPSVSSNGNIIKIYSKKINQLKSFFKVVNGFNKNNFLQSTGSATSANIKSDSVDYIFTDPPFGGNIMYSELNCIWESWIKIRTNNDLEAIESKRVGKSISFYQQIMSESFKEYFRILKPGKWMTVEFSNPSAIVWNTIQNSITAGGFIIANVAALDKKQKSINSYTTPKAVKQDLIISCYKPSSEFDQKFKQHQNTEVAIWDFLEEHLNHLPVHLVVGNSTTAIIERSPKILFDRLIAFYVQKSLPVPIDAGKFQQGLRERFTERDGMFFASEQVQEYDKKKKENPEFIQLSILVSSEQDGVLWLKNVLIETSLTYQDIQPQWMQALAGVRKGDVIPELATILEENFLKDDLGKWYTPDPENEADLEKLRTKRLLRQFDTYKEEAIKPKTKKIKEVRVEALRAGFKQCYQDKDFKSIVTIGDKIPNNLLMEDEVLLQFYDIASSRV